MRKLTDAYRERVGADRVVVVFERDPVGPEQTALDLELRRGDMLDV